MSNIITLDQNSDDFKNIESIVSKIAEENQIENVEAVHISISIDNSTIRFKRSCPMLDAIKKQEEPKDEESSDSILNSNRIKKID